MDHFIYLESNISSNFSLEGELNIRLGRASTAMAYLADGVWGDIMRTFSTKMKVYQACVLSTLLYGSKKLNDFSHQRRRPNAFHLCCLRRVLIITWLDQIAHKDVLFLTGMPSMFAILIQMRQR